MTAPYLNGKKAIPIPTNRRPVSSDGDWLTIRDASMHTLRHIDVAFPIGRFTAVTGPSGSGKSSLINGILYPALARKLHRANTSVGPHRTIDGTRSIDKIVQVDQSPLGNSPSSTPATYTGYSMTSGRCLPKQPLSKEMGFTSREFSFNVEGGRCPKCEGNGQCRIEMHFLADVWVECDACHGQRYQQRVLDVNYRGKSINDVLSMSIVQAKEVFAEEQRIMRVLNILDDVGLGYVSLGQSAPTLSGGEAQRVKLAAELSRPATGKTLYVFDEPTTGLHFDDIAKLLHVFQRLVDQGNTVIVIEHNLDVIKTADWIVELGPEAGWQGGQLVYAGTPEGLVEYTKAVDAQLLEMKPTKRRTARKQATAQKAETAKLISHTGRALADVLQDGPYEVRTSDIDTNIEPQEKSSALANINFEGLDEAAASRVLQSLITQSGAQSPREMEKMLSGLLLAIGDVVQKTGVDNEDDAETNLHNADDISEFMVQTIMDLGLFEFTEVKSDDYLMWINDMKHWLLRFQPDDTSCKFKIRLPHSFLSSNPPPPLRNAGGKGLSPSRYR